MKKFKTTILAMAVVAVMLLSSLNVFAVDNLDMGALQLFLDKLASTEPIQRELGAAVLEEFFADGNEGIDELKSSLSSFISEESLEKYGYSISDVQKELDRLKDWSVADRTRLVEYVKAGATSEIKDLILEQEKDDSDSGKDEEGPKAGETPTKDSDPTSPTTSQDDNEEVLVEVNFTDINSHWAKESIEFLAKRDIIKGKSEGIFDPEGKITRAEFTALIVRLFDLKPETNKTMNFNDMKLDAWYYEAVKAAYDNEIINGVSESSFGPLSNITREQMVTIIIRILEQKGLLANLDKTDKDLVLFNDKEQVSSWAIDSMSQAIKYGIISGRANNLLAPKDNATRAEAASIMMILYNLFNN